MPEVLKFGGSSLADSAAMKSAVKAASRHQGEVLILVSAMQGVTDLLLAAARSATERCDASPEISKFREKYAGVIADLGLQSEDGLATALNEASRELEAICQSLLTLGEATVKVMDRTVARGERLSALIFSALMRKEGLPTAWIDAQELIFLDRQFGALFPNLQKCEKAASKLSELWQTSQYIVVPGFIGTGPDQETVTLGRGGSDLSATVLAAATHASAVYLYKEVDGCMTADPRLVPEARVVPELHYREAAELAFYGAKILHPRTIIPLMEQQIPLYIRNTFRPENPGSRIAGDVAAGAFPVKALTAIQDQTLLAVEGKGMMGVPGIAARTFQALAAIGTSVTLISQASSEASICLSIPTADAKGAAQALREAFQHEMAQGLIEDVRLSSGQVVIAVVGLGMRGTKGIAARTFQALARAGVNIEAIAQGSSELNISIVINREQMAPALIALHREFRLERLRVFPMRDQADVGYSIFGFGQIGRTLLRQVLSQQNYFSETLHVNLHAISLMDSRGDVSSAEGLSPTELEDAMAYKERGIGLGKDVSVAGASRDWHSHLEKVLASNGFSRSIFVDTTATDSESLVMRALSSGLHVVLANKKPLTVPQARYDEIWMVAAAQKALLRYEATVGAGLPVLDTLAKLRESGDQIIAIAGCLSGTLGYLMSELESGTKFSDAVRHAHARGFTEPDPRDDLCGMDVARKALILARTIGKRLDLADVSVESLFTKELDHSEPRAFIDGLVALDGEWQQRIASANQRQAVWRYVARIGQDRVAVGLEEVPISSPLGRLRGTDNQVVIHTRRYDTNHLIVTGPGAGAEVTAAGVLNDMLAIATAKLD